MICILFLDLLGFADELVSDELEGEKIIIIHSLVSTEMQINSQISTRPQGFSNQIVIVTYFHYTYSLFTFAIYEI